MLERHARIIANVSAVRNAPSEIRPRRRRRVARGRSPSREAVARGRARVAARIAETTAEGRQRAQTHPPRAYPLAEGDPKGTLVGVQRRLLAFEGVVSRTTPRGSRNAPQNRLRFGGKIRPSGEPEGRASVCGEPVFHARNKDGQIQRGSATRPSRPDERKSF